MLIDFGNWWCDFLPRFVFAGWIVTPESFCLLTPLNLRVLLLHEWVSMWVICPTTIMKSQIKPWFFGLLNLCLYSSFSVQLVIHINVFTRHQSLERFLVWNNVRYYDRNDRGKGTLRVLALALFAKVNYGLYKYHTSPQCLHCFWVTFAYDYLRDWGWVIVYNIIQYVTLDLDICKLECNEYMNTYCHKWCVM